MSNSVSFTFVTPPRLVVGWGAATDERLVNEAKRLGKRPLIFAGNSLRKSGALDTILANLTECGMEATTHEGIPAEPDINTLQTAIEAVEAAKADCVLAIGGGSVLDIGKAAAAIASTGRTAREYFTGAVSVPESGIPIIAVPTTAGTGSEATWVSVLVDKETGEQYPRKASIRGGAMMPSVALLDAELTVSCPPSVTAHSGMDAFVQAVEAYTSVGANTLTDVLAFDAALKTGDNLLTAFKEPANREAREAMLLGSYMAGAALNTSRLGLVHGLAHPIGAVTGAAHGLICGMLMLPVTQFNYETVKEPYRAIFLSGFGITSDSKAERWWNKQLAEMNIPTRLSEIGVSEEHIDYIATESMKSGSTKANPRPVTIDDARAVLLSCL